MHGFMNRYKNSSTFNEWRKEHSFDEIVNGQHTKVIDIKAAEYLLLKVKHILDTNNVPFLLVFGTLLGVYRDKKFIEWDRDIDIALLKEQKEKVMKLVEDGVFAFYRIQLIRDVGYLYSLAYKSEYIDFHFFTKKDHKYVTGGVDEHVIKKEQIENPNSKIMFLGNEFDTVFSIEQYLVDQYGETWKIPTR